MSNVKVLRINLRNIWVFLCGVPCLFMLIVTSRGFTIIKTVLLALTTLSCFGSIFIRNSKIKKNHFYFVMFFVFYFMMSLILGMIKGFEWEFKTGYSLIEYYMFTPVIILIISSFLISNEAYIENLIKILRVISLFVVIMNVWKILAKRSFVPDIDFLDLFYVSSNQSIGGLALRISNEHNLIFLLPFFTVLLFTERRRKDRVIDLVILMIGVVYGLLSGRKALEILVFATISVMILYMAVKKGKMRPLIISCVSAFAVVLITKQIAPYIGIENIIESAINTIQNGITTQNAGMVKRSRSIYSLIRLWFSSPIIGNGLNSYGDFSSAGTEKWSYEVYYVALLAQTGIIGIGFFASAVFYIIWNLLKKYKNSEKPLYLAAFFGMVCFLAAGATNPMVYIPWPWILSLSISCCSLNDKFDNGEV